MGTMNNKNVNNKNVTTLKPKGTLAIFMIFNFSPLQYFTNKETNVQRSNTMSSGLQLQLLAETGLELSSLDSQFDKTSLIQEFFVSLDKQQPKNPYI